MKVYGIGPAQNYCFVPGLRFFWKLRIVWLPTFRNGQRCCHSNMGPTGCPETSVTNVPSVRSKNSEGLNCTVDETVLSQQLCIPVTSPSGPRPTSTLFF